MAN
ncbi:hypothetical protein D018_3002A, partial [Vibrio parahaemolyticus VP2007-007]|jgi:hypothetical protein